MAYVGTLRDLLPGNLGNVASEVLTFTDAWTWTGAHVFSAGLAGSSLKTPARVAYARSQIYNLDNGAGTTIDDVILVPTRAITITSIKIVYVGATTGTVAAGNITIGTAVDGTEIAAATAYGNTKAVGTTTAVTIASGAVAANTMITVRHTGVAATAAGEAFVQIEYTVDD